MPDPSPVGRSERRIWTRKNRDGTVTTWSDEAEDAICAVTAALEPFEPDRRRFIVEQATERIEASLRGQSAPSSADTGSAKAPRSASS
jgi:hypothetical protein